MQPACMGIPAELLVHNIRLAAIEFTEYSGILTQTYLVDLQKDVTEYPIDVYDCMRFIALRKVCYGEQTRYCPAYEPKCCSIGGNTFWYQDGALRIGEAPAYDEPEALTVEIVVAVSQDSCFMPEELYQDWAEPIAMGAIARCLMIAGQPFYDANSARLFEFKFKQGKVNARQRVERSRIRGPMKIAARRFV
jgi:hypothetical protein